MISSERASLKTEFLVELCTESLADKNQVHYLDFDLQFSSFIRSKLATSGSAETYLSRYFTPHVLKVAQIGETLVQVLSGSEFLQGGMIVIDSINGLQMLLRRGNFQTDAMTSNRQAALIITLFQKLARDYSKRLVMSNITRTRPRGDDQVVKWKKEPVGGRMIKFKTDLTLLLSDRVFDKEAEDQGHTTEVTVIQNLAGLDKSLSQVLEVRIPFFEQQ
jgi:hypothetical protein